MRWEAEFRRFSCDSAADSRLVIFWAFFRVIPQARGRGLRFEILDIGLESVDVQRLGDGFVFGAGFADRLGKVKFCHRGLPYC